MPGIGIITNPHSKMNKRNPRIQRLLGYIVGERGNLELTNSLSDLAKAAENFRDRSIDVLAINGGDGTISRTLTAFVRAYKDQTLPPVLILRGGTINVLAENLRLKGSPEAILVRYLESLSGLRDHTTVSIRSLRIQDHYGFLFGNGMISNYLEEFYKNKTGPLGAVYLFLKIYLWRFLKPELFYKTIGERVYQLKFGGPSLSLSAHSSCAVMGSTIEHMPLGPKLFPNATKSKDHFSVFSLRQPAKDLFWRLPLALTFNQEGQRFGRLNRQTNSLVIEPADGKLQKYSLDGELFEASDGKLEISLGPLIDFIVV